jgi:hypothetical protein
MACRMAPQEEGQKSCWTRGAIFGLFFCGKAIFRRSENAQQVVRAFELNMLESKRKQSGQ